ncbi:MAG: methyltransferase domain-containing protein [Acidobacteria bacterium]|nr:methyltransferase domain-containing protein [Acidobacteriota bacterium]
MSACRACGGPFLAERLEAGLHPICNRFLTDPEARERRYALTLGVCARCGLPQLLNPIPAGEIKSPFDWITYNEPEGHLDDLVESLLGLPGIGPQSRVGGVTYKDDTTLHRLVRRGVTQAWSLTPSELDLPGSRAEVEQVQARLDPARAKALVARKGPVELLLVRHILEHAHDLAGFLAALRGLLSPGGYAVFEVPDATTMFATGDYSPLWEEHLVYFTPETFGATLRRHGFRVVAQRNYPYVLENSLTVVATAAEPEAGPAQGPGPELRAYLAGLGAARARLHRWLEAAPGPIALLGGGHLACTFLNLMELGDRIACVVDDDPHRIGLFMPGSHRPIRPTSALVDEGIATCLLSLNPLNEAKVLDRHRAFLEGGGVFRSIFPASALALPAADQ